MSDEKKVYKNLLNEQINNIEKKSQSDLKPITCRNKLNYDLFVQYSELDEIRKDYETKVFENSLKDYLRNSHKYWIVCFVIVCVLFYYYCVYY